jgi:hypothetical protein
LSLPQHLVDKARSLVRASDVARGEVSLKRKKTAQGYALEAKGYEAWLRRLGARTFTGSFSWFHHEFWTWYWPVRMKLLAGQQLDPEELVMLVMWFRGGGKSSNVEWACIAEGALGEGVTDEPGFVGYVCDTEAQAKGHIQSIRDRLDSAEIAYHYPGLSNPRIDRHGYQTAWRQDYLATQSHWGIVPIGLEEGVRGGRLFDLRFSMFVFDDVDSRKDSMAAVEKKLKIIAHEILPAGTSDTLKIFPQNLIHEDSVLNQIYTRRSDILSERRESGPVKAFDELELAPDERHPGKYVIKSARPTWPDVDMRSARVYLADSGRAAFLAEYQHEFDADKTDRVLPHWRDDVHVITQSQFESRYGSCTIPFYWGRRWFNDWAKTNTEKHTNVAGCVSVSAQDTPLPGCVFLSDCLSFEAGTEADDVALRILKTISPVVTVGTGQKTWDEVVRDAHSRTGLSAYSSSITEVIEMSRDARSRVIPPLVTRILEAQGLHSFRGSHEQNNNALKVYREVYGLPFRATNPGADGGVELLNHLMRVDRTRRHAFKSDALGEDGKYKLGFCRFYLVVPDSEAPVPATNNPASLHDSARARYQLGRWRNLPVRSNESGEVERGPEKRNDDFGNGLQMCVFDGLPVAVELTERQMREARLPAHLRAENIPSLPPDEQCRAVQARDFWLNEFGYGREKEDEDERYYFEGHFS